MAIDVAYMVKRAMEDEGKGEQDTRDRNIQAQLAPRMVDLRRHKKLSDVFGVLRDMSVGVKCLDVTCGMTHGDISPANGLAYWREDGELVGVLNDFDGMVFGGRFGPPKGVVTNTKLDPSRLVEDKLEVLDPD